MTTNPEAATTPAAQQQHNPPSLPNSPHPKRVKTDEMQQPNGSVGAAAAAAAQQQSSNLATVRENTSTPTPTNYNTLPSPSSLPPMSSLLPSISSTLPMHMSPLPNMISSSSNNNNNNAMPMMLPGSIPGSLPLPSSQTATATPTAAPLVAPPPLLIKKLTPAATTPTRGSAFAAGYDLYASSPLTLPSKNKALISTGLAIAVPPGTYGRIAPRSGLASKHFLDTGAGVIDADYRGEVKVLMFNFSDVDYEVKQGERVAQLVLERILTPEVVVVDDLEESVRGGGGFGSTGYA